MSGRYGLPSVCVAAMGAVLAVSCVLGTLAFADVATVVGTAQAASAVSAPVGAVAGDDGARAGAASAAPADDAASLPSTISAQPAAQASPDDAATATDSQASAILVEYAYERTEAICSYLVAENATELAGRDAGLAATIYGLLGIEEMAQIFAFTTWDDLYAGVYTLAEGTSPFLGLYRQGWNRRLCGAGTDVADLIDHVQDLVGLPRFYEKPADDWTGDALVVLAARESGYLFATLFSEAGTTDMKAATHLVRLPEKGEWVSFLADLRRSGSVIPETSLSAFAGTEVDGKRIDPLPDSNAADDRDGSPN